MLTKIYFALLRSAMVVIQRVCWLLTLGQLPPFASVTVVVEQEGRYLLVRRSDGKGYAFPGGFLRLNEDAQEAAVRETREETGLEIGIDGTLTVLSGRRRGTWIRSVNIVFSGHVAGGELRSSLEGEPCWVELPSPDVRLAFDYDRILKFLSAPAESR